MSFAKFVADDDAKNEVFELHHPKITVDNNGQTVSNTSMFFTYSGSAYASVEIPSMSDERFYEEATWIVHVDQCGDKSEVCLGVAASSTIGCEKSFATVADSYGYTSRGMLYCEGQVDAVLRNGETFRSSDSIKVVLSNRTGCGEIQFYKKAKDADRFEWVQCCKVKARANLAYKFAVYMTCAKVTIAQSSRKRVTKKRTLNDMDEYGEESNQNNQKSRPLVQTPPKKKQGWQCDKCSSQNSSISKFSCKTCNSPRKNSDAESEFVSSTSVFSTTSSSAVNPMEVEHFDDHDDEKSDPASLVGLHELQRCIVEKFTTFRDAYDAAKLRQMCDKNPESLMNPNGELQQMLRRYENDLQLLIETSCNFDECVKNTVGEVEEIVRAHESRYEDWDLDMIMQWIEKLDNGDFKPYMKQLRDGFEKAGITKGALLPNVDYLALTTECKIDSFPIKKKLEKHFESLKKHATSKLEL